MNEISIAGKSYSDFSRQQFNLYSTSSCPLYKFYMESRSIELEEDKEFTAEQVSSMAPKKYNNIITSVRWSNKYAKDAHILALVGLAQNLSDNSKNPSENPIRESMKGDPAYIRYLPPCML